MGKHILNFFFAVIFACLLKRIVADIIHRSECRRDAVYKATDRNKMLASNDGKTLTVSTAETLAKCARYCTSHPQGRSFNFKKGGNPNCQVLDIDKTNSSGKIENATGWIHYEPISKVCTAFLSALNAAVF